MTRADTSAAEQLPLPLYRVRLEVFEGPLDLLLHLIKKNEVQITDIPISVITEQYLKYLDWMRELRLDVAGEFLVMAATLMLIKSRMLLPADEEFEEDDGDPRQELVQQLREYQKYREAALALAERPLLGRDVFARPRDGEAAPGPPQLRVELWDLVEALKQLLDRRKPEPVHVVELEPVSLRACAERMLACLGAKRKVRFEELFDAGASRLEIVATFLVLLELVRLGALQATQAHREAPIEIELLHAEVGWEWLADWEEEPIRSPDVEDAE
ncbi:MAG: segregation and condensation protein A [Candidatus Binatia bacterium]|nr:MAG: segregation and condensation protein A [Candidatus Binatia bacterium]